MSYLHLTFSNEDVRPEAGWGRTLCSSHLEGRQGVSVRRLYKPSAPNLKRFNCPSCRVLFDAWLDTYGTSKRCSFRRWNVWRKELAARGGVDAQALLQIGWPPLAEDRRIRRSISVSSLDVPIGPHDPSGIEVVVPANAPPEKIRELALVELELVREARKGIAVRENAAKLRNAQDKVKRCQSKLKTYTTLLKKWQRRVRRYEAKGTVST